MTAATGAVIVADGTQKTLESNGGSITAGSVVAASVANYTRGTDGDDYPDAEFVLMVTFTTAPTENGTIGLYARPLGVDGSNNTEVPEATRPTYTVGSFAVNNVTTAQYIILRARDLPKSATYYLHNLSTGQTIPTGWTLKVTPRTTKTA